MPERHRIPRPGETSSGGLVALAVIAVASGLVFGGAVFSDDAFYARDVMNYYWPTRHAAAESYRAGELPQWDYSYQSGVPALGNIHAAVLYPPNALYQWLSFPRAYAWLIWLHHIGAGLGAYVLLRRLGLQLQPAIAGALAFLLSGYLVGLVNAGPLMAGVAYVPWAMALVLDDRAWTWRAGLVGALLAAQAMSGDPQSVLFSAIGCLLLIAFFPAKRLRLGVFLVASALGALLAAAQLLPALELLPLSTRSQPTQQFFTSFSFHPLRLFELVFAFPFGKYVEPPFFWPTFAVQGPGALPFAMSSYLGAAAAVVGFLGIGADRRTALAASLLCLGLILALGPHFGLGNWLLHLPPFRFFRYPEKYLLLASLGMAILVANGFARLGIEGAPRRRIAAVGVAMGLIFLLAIVATLWRGPLAAGVARLLAAHRLRADPRAVVEAGLLSMFTSAFWGGLALLWLLRSRPGTAAGYLWGLTALVAGDLLLAARPLIWTANNSLYTERPAVVDALWRLGQVRPFRYFRDFLDLERTAPNDLTLEGRYQRRRWELETLKSNLGGIFGLEESSGYGAVSLARWDRVALTLYDEPAKLAAIFNVCWVLSSDAGGRIGKMGGFKPALNLAYAHLGMFESPVCLPRIRSVRSIKGVESSEEAIQELARPGADLVNTAVVERVASRAFEPAEVLNVAQARHQASALIRAGAGGGFVIFSMSHYPGWRAFIDGRRLGDLRVVDGAIIGVEVPSGEHRLEFKFSDPALPWGVGLSLLGLAATAAALFTPKMRFRDAQRREPA